MSGNIITLKDIRKRFGSMDVINNINIEIKRGEFLVILGVSGCGKTTLLKIISGLEQPTGGRVLIEEDREVINYIFQHLALLPWRNVYDNIAIGLEFKRKPAKEINKLVRECIDLVGLSGFEEYMPYQLSGGMKQRVAFARAIVNKSKIILMDEPFNSLDFFTRKQMQEKALSLSRDFGMTCILVTHDVDEAISMADRLIVLSSKPSYVLKQFEIGNLRNELSVAAIKQNIFSLLSSCD